MKGERCQSDRSHGKQFAQKRLAEMCSRRVVRVLLQLRRSRDMLIRCLKNLRAARECYWRPGHPFREMTLNIFDRCTKPGTLLYLVSMMLIAGAIFLMCFIFVIPAGLMLILTRSIMFAMKCGRRMRALAQSIRIRSNA